MAGLNVLDLYPRGTFGEQLGEVLNQLGENVSHQLQRRYQAGQLAPAFEQLGASPEQAQALAMANPQVQASYLRGAQAAQIGAQGQQQELANQEFIENILGEQRQESGLNVLSGVPEGAPAISGEPDVRLPGIASQERDELLSPEAQTFQRKHLTSEARLQREVNKLEQRLDDPRLSASQKSRVRQELEKRSTRLDKMKSELGKEFKTELADMRKKSKSAQIDLQDLSRLQELEQEGLVSAGYNEFLQRSGLNIPALMNPESEEFQKISQRFIRKAKDYYGGRISNMEMEQFMKTIPSLSQSPEGRKRVIAQMKNLARAEIETYKSAQKIIKENEGIPPRDFLEKIDASLDKKRDSLASKFKKDLEIKIPAGQGTLATGLQAAAGSAAKPLAAASLGAGLGSFLPGIGTAAGGLLGAGAGSLGSLLQLLGR